MSFVDRPQIGPLRATLRSLYAHLPEEFRQAVLVRIRARPFWERAGLVFLHIPKTGGMSISHAIYRHHVGHARALDIERWGSSRLKVLPRFAISRNPWDRLVSAYRFAKRGRGIGGPLQAPVTRPERYQVPECETFERFVKEWLAARDLLAADPIFRPQCTYVCDDNGKLLVDHVGRLEDLGPTRDFLRRQLGSVPVIPKSNRSGKPVDYRTFYTPELVDIVGKIYAADVHRFGFKFDEGPVRPS